MKENLIPPIKSRELIVHSCYCHETFHYALSKGNEVRLTQSIRNFVVPRKRDAFGQPSESQFSKMACKILSEHLVINKVRISV